MSNWFVYGVPLGAIAFALAGYGVLRWQSHALDRRFGRNHH